MNGPHLRTPGIAPHWATEETMFLIEDELPIWSRDFSDDTEPFAVALTTEDRMTGEGFYCTPDVLHIELPAHGDLTPAEAVRLARDLLAAANTATGETPASNAL